MEPSRSNTIAATARFDVRGKIVRCLRYFGLWTIVVGLFAAQWYTHDALFSEGHPWPMIEYLRWSIMEWYAWALLAPLVFWLAALCPIDSPLRLRFLFVHLVASVAVTCLAVVAGAEASHLFLPDKPPLDEQLVQFFSKHVAMGYITYWVLVALRQALHFFREKNRRELEASQLAAELAQSRLQVLKMQLQPHFLFNTLHAIATLIDEEPSAAEEMLLRLSELLRAFLEDYQGQEISLGHELALIDLYLGIQRTRFKDRLTTRVHAAPETLDCAVPSLILQPLVENAIQHGIGRNVGQDSIEIESSRQGNDLCIEIRNRNSALEHLPEGFSRRGIGLSNSRLRLKELYGDAAQIQLVAMLPRGVICRLRLPMRRMVPGVSPYVGAAA